MEEWITDEEDPDLKIRTELYEAAAGQFARYVNAVMLNVGGIYLTDVNSNTAGGPQAVSVPKETGARLAVTDTALPLLDPEGEIFRGPKGLTVWPAFPL